ncbi:Hypothetical_protein [Hexamita inflata]|uniref:Hypothetical_protein n=1 Tax=Hexamita inflata TaxID=28002 RepID=A0AA86NY70_9EUKA|nr:Hypothetical protein HINF_LOCUS14544 [Hexamita inflata]
MLFFITLQVCLITEYTKLDGSCSALPTTVDAISMCGYNTQLSESNICYCETGFSFIDHQYKGCTNVQGIKHQKIINCLDSDEPYISLDQHRCVSRCFTGEALNNNKTQCICIQNYELQVDRCVLTSCAEGTYLDVSRQKCVSSCEWPIYSLSDDEKSCICGENYSLSERKDICYKQTDKCGNGEIITVGGLCQSICPPDQQINDDYSACLCKPQKYYDYKQDLCVSICDCYLIQNNIVTCSYAGEQNCPYYQVIHSMNICTNECDNIDSNDKLLCSNGNQKNQNILINGQIWVLLVAGVIIFFVLRMKNQ